MHATTQIATLVDCSDVSPAFSANSVEGMGVSIVCLYILRGFRQCKSRAFSSFAQFYADLHHLIAELSKPESVDKQAAMEPLLRKNIADLLLATRPLSFS